MSARKSAPVAPAPPTSDPSHVFVLTREESDHGNGHQVITETLGVYSSKEAAAAVAGNVDTPYGTFAEALANDFADHHEDNRDNADCGVLLQIGSGDYGEGDYVRLLLTRFPVVGMP